MSLSFRSITSSRSARREGAGLSQSHCRRTCIPKTAYHPQQTLCGLLPFALLATTVAVSFAQTPEPAIPPAHVAIINLQKAVSDTQEIRKAQANLQAKYKPRQDSIETLQRSLQDIQRQLSGPNLTPESEAQLRQSAAEKQKQLQRQSEDLQSDVNADRQDILGRAGRQMNEVVRKIAEQRGIDVVVDVTTTLYFKPALEITAEATAAYDKAYPVTP